MEKPVSSNYPAELWLPFVQNRPTVRCATGHLIYVQDTQATCFYYLKSGKVKSFIQSEEGGERILKVYTPGTIFGVAAFFDEMPRVSSAMATEPCEVVSIDRDLVMQEFARDPHLALSMLKYLGQTVRLLSNQVDDMAFRPAPARVARYLLANRGADGKVRATQEEIAAHISTSWVTVSRVLQSFAQKGWLEIKYGGITLKAPDKIEDFARG